MVYGIDKILEMHDKVFVDTSAFSLDEIENRSFLRDSGLLRNLFERREAYNLRSLQSSIDQKINLINYFSRINSERKMYITKRVNEEALEFIRILNDTYQYLHNRWEKQKHGVIKGNGFLQPSKSKKHNINSKVKRAKRRTNKFAERKKRIVCDDEPEDAHLSHLNSLKFLSSKFQNFLSEGIDVYEGIELPHNIYKRISLTDSEIILSSFHYMSKFPDKSVAIITGDYDLRLGMSYYRRMGFFKSRYDKFSLYIVRHSEILLYTLTEQMNSNGSYNVLFLEKEALDFIEKVQ